VRSEIRRLTVVLSSVALLTLPACRNRRNLAERVLDDPAHELASQRCGGSGQIVRPLIIEWPATERASLEGRLRRDQVIVVRYEGCTVEVMRDCAAPQTGYDYIGITRKNDRIGIRTTDELYANMPLTAVSLEAKLAKAGELSVAMALVGNFEAQRSRFDWSELVGRCDGATHVIAAAQVGAFEFFTGAGAEIGVGVEAEGVAGVGGRSTASREILNEDGDPVSCESSSPDDLSPPPECHALLRLELSALDGLIPTCEAGSVWNGSACVLIPSSPPPEPVPQPVPAPLPEPVPAPVPGPEPTPEVRPRPPADEGNPQVVSESDRIARQMCEISLQCEAEAVGMLPPEGKALERQMNTCVTMTRRMINDYTRPQARKCVAEFPSSGCAAFKTCVQGPSLPDDDDDW
jgi:hypothetical protein